MTKASDEELADKMEFDTEQFSKPVTRVELVSLLMKVDILIHTSQAMAFAAASENLEEVKRLRSLYQNYDKEFVRERDGLVSKVGTSKSL